MTLELMTLVLKRYIVSGKNILITSSLSSIATGRIIGPKLLPTRNDYAIESLIGSNFNSYVVKHSQVSTLFGYLTKVAQVRLDGKKVELRLSKQDLLFVFAMSLQGLMFWKTRLCYF